MNGTNRAGLKGLRGRRGRSYVLSMLPFVLLGLVQVVAIAAEDPGIDVRVSLEPPVIPFRTPLLTVVEPE